MEEVSYSFIDILGIVGELHIESSIRNEVLQNSDLMKTIIETVSKNTNLKFDESDIKKLVTRKDITSIIDKVKLQSKDADIDDTLLDLLRSIDKIIFLNTDIKKQIIKKYENVMVLKGITQENIRKLGGDEGIMTRNFLRSYIDSLDLIGRGLLVKYAYDELNKTGHKTFGSIIKSMGGTIYNDQIRIYQRTDGTVVLIDDLNDEEKDRLGITKYKEVDTKGNILYKEDYSSDKLKAIREYNENKIKLDDAVNKIKKDIDDILKNLPESVSKIIKDNFKSLVNNENIWGTDIKALLKSNNIEIPFDNYALLNIFGNMSNIINNKDPDRETKLNDLHKQIYDLAYSYGPLIDKSGMGYEHSKIIQALSKINPVGGYVMESDIREYYKNLLKNIDLAIIKFNELVDKLASNIRNLGRELKNINEFEKRHKELKKIKFSKELTEPIETALTKKMDKVTEKVQIKKDNTLAKLNKFINGAKTDGKNRFIFVHVFIGEIVPEQKGGFNGDKNDKSKIPKGGIIDDVGHANFVMIDLERKRIEHYEPHGVDSQYNRQGMLNVINEIFGKKEGRYSGKLSALSSASLNKEHVDEGKFELKSIRDMSLTYNNLGAQSIANYPYCLSWCYYIGLLRIMYPDKTLLEIETISKSKRVIYDDELIQKDFGKVTEGKVTEIDMLQQKYEKMDGCALKERIENFTIFMLRLHDLFNHDEKDNKKDSNNNMVNVMANLNNSSLSLGSRHNVFPYVDIVSNQKGGSKLKIKNYRI